MIRLGRKGIAAAVALAMAAGVQTQGHEAHTSAGSPPGPAVKPLPMLVENTGPMAPARTVSAGSIRVSGQGFWRFIAVTNRVLPIPAAARPHVKGAHGTLVVDAARDVVYWGLEKVGWIAFREQLTQSEVVQGDPAFSRGNLHGADLLPRATTLPLVAVADNVSGAVYLSDTTFQQAATLAWPQGGPYRSQSEYHPTDVAFTGPGEIYVTDGYGQAYFMPASTEPPRFRGEFLGGKGASQTPHGITYDRESGSLLVSARPEGQVKRWSIPDQAWVEAHGLPPGSTVCDVEFWGDYALAPCLNGPQQSPGPIYIIHRKKQAIVSVLRPKEDLGFAEAQHLHDATWYFAAEAGRQELYILFTNWNPGGVGALKLVKVAD